MGRNIVEKIIKIKLTADEKKAFKHSVNAVKKTCAEVDEMTK